MKTTIYTLLVALAIATTTESAVAAQRSLPRRAGESRVHYLTRAVNYHTYVAKHGKGYNRWWHKRALRWTQRNLNQALRPEHYDAWMCIHRYEGKWTDSGAPYYGGLQMDMEFQRDYGADYLARKGTADHWTPLEQMIVAERAYKSGRGFYPWPNTARYCHLL